MKITTKEGLVIEGTQSELEAVLKNIGRSTPPVVVKTVVKSAYKPKRHHVRCQDCGKVWMSAGTPKFCIHCRAVRGAKAMIRNKAIKNGMFTGSISPKPIE